MSRTEHRFLVRAYDGPGILCPILHHLYAHQYGDALIGPDSENKAWDARVLSLRSLSKR